jgi:hypothetical protein
MDDKSWFICTIAREGLHNWTICKNYEIWGIPSNGRNITMASPKPGDILIVYHAGNGLRSICEVTGTWKSPSSKDEAPWAGGIFRYGKVFPFRVLKEVEVPIKVTFESNKIIGTDINLTILRRGFGMVSKKDGKRLFEMFS